MKKTLAHVMLCLLCLLTPLANAARALDFSRVIETNGRLTGEINTGAPLNHDPDYDTTVYIDCDAPPSLTVDQWVRLTTEFWATDRRSFAAALEAVGVDTKRGKLTRSMNNPLQRGISYKQERAVNLWGCANAKLRTKEMQSIVDTALKLFDNLGFSVSIESVADYGERAWPAYGYAPDGSLLPDQADWRRQALAQEDEQKRDPTNYLSAGGVPLLRGLPVGAMSYPIGGAREPDARCGITCHVSVFANKNGQLLNVLIEGIPLEKSATPLQGEPHDWREAFERLNAQQTTDGCSCFNALRTDLPLEDGEGTVMYATRNVLTSITPVWVGLLPNELVPGYCFTIEAQRRQDGVCLYEWSGCVDMVDLNIP